MNTLPKCLEDIILDYKYQMEKEEHKKLMGMVLYDLLNIIFIINESSYSIRKCNKAYKLKNGDIVDALMFLYYEQGSYYLFYNINNRP